VTQDRGVVRGLEQHARDAVRPGERLRILPAKVGGVEHERGSRGRRFGAQPARELIAVHERHQHVRDHEIRARLACARERLAAVGRAQHAMPRALEQRRKRFAIRAAVVGDQDGCHC